MLGAHSKCVGSLGDRRWKTKLCNCYEDKKLISNSQIVLSAVHLRNNRYMKLKSEKKYTTVKDLMISFAAYPILLRFSKLLCVIDFF